MVAAVVAASVEVETGVDLETQAGLEAGAELEIGAGLDAEETQNEGQRMPESESGAAFAFGPFRVALGWVIVGAAARAQVERGGPAAEPAAIGQPAEEAEFEWVVVGPAVAEPVVAEMGKALALVGYTKRSADDHTHLAQQRYILPECVAAAEVVEAGAGPEERRNEESKMPEYESGAGFALGPFQVVLG